MVARSRPARAGLRCLIALPPSDGAPHLNTAPAEVLPLWAATVAPRRQRRINRSGDGSIRETLRLAPRESAGNRRPSADGLAQDCDPAHQRRVSTSRTQAFVSALTYAAVTPAGHQ